MKQEANTRQVHRPDGKRLPLAMDICKGLQRTCIKRRQMYVINLCSVCSLKKIRGGTTNFLLTVDPMVIKMKKILKIGVISIKKYQIVIPSRSILNLRRETGLRIQCQKPIHLWILWWKHSKPLRQEYELTFFLFVNSILMADARHWRLLQFKIVLANLSNV